MNGVVHTSGEGDVMPPVWWRLAGHFPLRRRYRDSRISGLPLLAFADEFHTSLSVHGRLYLDLSHLTGFNARHTQPSPQRHAFHTLTAAFPDVFHTVIGRDGPDAVWLALRLTRLNDQIADALLHASHVLATPAAAA